MKKFSTKKKVVIILLFLLTLFALELGRETIIYRMVTKKLEQGYWKIKSGMTKEEVKQVLGEPDSTYTPQASSGEYLYWFAREHQGWLWSLLGLAPVKGHYEIIVEFDKEGKTVDIFSGVN